MVRTSIAKRLLFVQGKTSALESLHYCAGVRFSIVAFKRAVFFFFDTQSI